MVQTYKRKKQKDINEGSMEKAVQAVLQGVTFRKAADLFGARFNTLFYHVKKGENTAEKTLFIKVYH
jgi:hypothetical protein